MSGVEYDKKVEDGELFKWDKEGAVIEGILNSYEEKMTSNGPGHIYEVETKNGVMAFFAPTLLNKKLSGKKLIGHIVKVTFTETSKTMSGNPLKHFEVLHTEATEAKLKVLGIDLMEKVEDAAEETKETVDEEFGKKEEE